MTDQQDPRISFLQKYSYYCRRFRAAKENSGVLRHFALSPLRTAESKSLPPQKQTSKQQRNRGAQSYTIEHIDLSKNYLGPRGLLALFAAAVSTPLVEVIDASDAKWFACDEKPTSLCGDDVVRLVCQMLTYSQTCSIKHLILLNNDFSTSAYLWFVDVAERCRSLERISVNSEFFEPHEIEHINATFARKSNRKAEGASPSSSSFSIPKPPTSNVLTQKRKAEPQEEEEAAAIGIGPYSADGEDLLFNPTAPVGAERSAKGKQIVASFFAGVGMSQQASLRVSALSAELTALATSSTALIIDRLIAMDRCVGKLLGPTVANPDPIAPKITPMTPEQYALVSKTLRINGIGAHLTDEGIDSLCKVMRFARFMEEDFIFEQGDLADFAFLLTSGGAVAHRSEELTMEYPQGALIGEEEFMSPTPTAELRRFTVRAKPKLIPLPMQELVSICMSKRKASAFLGKEAGVHYYPTAESLDEMKDNEEELMLLAATKGKKKPKKASKQEVSATGGWLIPKTVFAELIVKPVFEHRRKWRRFIDSLPPLNGLGVMAKLSLTDVVREAVYGHNEVVTSGFPMLKTCFFVMDGRLTVYFQSTDVKRLLRGDIFICSPDTDVARCSVVSNAKKTVLAWIDEPRFQTLPTHVQLHLAKKAEVFTVEEAPPVVT